MRATLLLLFCAYVVQISAQQVTRIDQYKTGTQISYFLGQCGQTPPEAVGKLTFCDANDNLGVVTASLGLNNTQLIEMFPNHFDATEIYATPSGVSMRNANGTWDNIPEEAIPTRDFSGQFTNNSLLSTGLMDANGLLHLIVTNGTTFENEYWRYDRTDHTFEQGVIPGALSPQQIAYDAANERILLLAGFGSAAKIFQPDGAGDLMEVFSLNTLPFALGSVGPQSAFEVVADSLFVGNNEGLVTFHTTNFGFQRYDFSTTARLPFDRVDDVAFAADGAVWLAQGDDFGGALVRLAPTTRIPTTFTLPNPEYPSFNFSFLALEVRDNGQIAASTFSAFPLVNLAWDTPDPQWTITSLEELMNQGVPFNDFPTQICNFNDQLYYIRGLGALPPNPNAEVLIELPDGSFVTRNESAPTSISEQQIDGYDYLLPDRRGGIYAHDYLNDFISYIDATGQFRSIESDFLSSVSPAVNGEDKLVYDRGTLLGWSVLDLPLRREISGVPNNDAIVGAYGNALAFFDRSTREYLQVVGDDIVDRDTLPNDFITQNFAQIGVDDDGVGWLAVTFSSGTQVVSYDPATNTTQFVETGVFIGDIQQILPAPDGEVFIVGREGILHFDGTEFSSRTSEEDIALDQIYDAAVDEAGRLWLLTNFVGTIGRIDDFAEDPTVVLYSVEEDLPFLSLFGASSMALASDGGLWLEAGNEFAMIKITDDLLEGSYRPTGGVPLLTGRVYVDLNANGQYDEGEAVPDQVVTLVAGDRTEETTTRADGSYAFLVIEGNVEHRITLANVRRFYLADERQRSVAVTSSEQDYPDNDFVLRRKDYNSLYIQTTNKEGAWGFDREGFENTFTTAVTNLSSTEEFRELELGFIYHHLDETMASLPEVLDVKITKLTPNGAFLLIDHISIDTRTHDWEIRNVDLATFTAEEVTSATFGTEVQSDTVRVFTEIGDIGPLETIIVEVMTDLFDPTSAGTTIVYSTSQVSSPDLQGNSPVIPGTVIIYPPIGLSEGTITPGTLDNDPNSPYVSPDDIYEEPPVQTSPEVYVDLYYYYYIYIYSSYDPNDKLVDGGLPTEINDTDVAQRWLTYTVRFENTGNFSAKDVWIIDTLHPGLQANSLELLQSSHGVEVDLLPDEELSIVRFSFENIFLPFQDSLNDGYVRFALRLSDEVDVNDVVTNQAAIYFDQNPPIITNVVRNRFVEITGPTGLGRLAHNQAQVTIFPNPTAGQLNILTEDQLLNSRLFDGLGRLVADFGSRMQVDISPFPSGLYWLEVSTLSGLVTKRLVVE